MDAQTPPRRRAESEGAEAADPSGDRDSLDTAAMGARVRALRQRGGLSTADLALRAGVAAGLISQIERGLGNPSLRTLDRLRLALGVSLGALIEGEPAAGADPAFVRRRGARPHLTVGPFAVDKAILSPPATEGLRFLLITMPPGSCVDEMIREKGQKAGLVLRGAVRLAVAGREAVLTEGDSFQFDADLPHVLVNDGPRPAEFVWIMAGPAYATPE
ncbi:cupin domain-containing protein [uncultured Methylobacterium sp.]|jgi:transcriptional regulator with XRE-family HTH domain|uniref:cupin domain-containing protein n=1 Tax=uncultured Methylobacterium sp. TaxID=157278 RepID=UPI0026115D54|nr:cupin domain-containing protein [uncultured Methylobacterium sp.]